RVCASSSAGSATPSAGRPWSAGVVSVVMHRPWPTPGRDGAGRPEAGTDRSRGGTVDVGLPPRWAWEERRARGNGRPDDHRRHREATGRDGRRGGRTGPGEEPSTWACRPAGHGRIVGPVRKDAPMTSADTPSVDERLHDLDQRLVARIAEITRDELAGRRREQ